MLRRDFLGIVFALVFVVVIFRLITAEFRRFRYEHAAILDVVERCQAAVPPDVDRQTWKNAWVRTEIAILNVCAPEHVDINELSRLRKGIEQRADGPLTVDTLYWIWDELARIESTGRYGNGYVERYRGTMLRDFSGGPESGSPNGTE